MSSSQTSLATAVAHAISFLLNPLTSSYSPTVVRHLQKVLDSQLQTAFAPTWSPQDPSYGSGHRCFTLTRSSQPPRILYEACTAAGIRWSDWMTLLKADFILMIDPGRVAYQRADGRLVLLWADDSSPSPKGHKTKAQQLLEDECDDEIFTLINREVHGGARPDSRLSTSSSSCSSGSSHSSPTMSRRERARMAKVFIDPSKTDVTHFDGGRTKILTGGVMLGGRTPSA